MKIKKQDVETLLEHIPIDFGGGCSVGKAYMMAWLIDRFDLRTSLDIGVYRGRSLFPQALAHRNQENGVVYGVDPWAKDSAREQDDPSLPDRPEISDDIQKWVEQTDFQQIYESVVALKEKLQFDSQCVLVRQTSEAAINTFQDQNIYFNMIHVDGNHDEKAVMQDVKLYAPRLRRNGFLVLDDVSWSSVRPAYDWLSNKMCHVFERIGNGDDYAVFWNGRSPARAILLRQLLKQANAR